MKKIIFSFILLLATLSLFAQESNNGKQLWAKSVLNEKAPELTVEEWISEKPDLKGKFVIIDFWATWCGPCRGAIPKFNELQKKFKNDIVIIGLSDESAEKIKAFKETPIEYANAVDTKGTMKKALEVKGIPHVIVIDPQGIVRWEGFPMLKGHELTPEILEELIRKYKK